VGPEETKGEGWEVSTGESLVEDTEGAMLVGVLVEVRHEG
jgi:hypothetical protein